MNVCESCIVKDHKRCIIKSYVQWLQDSDYSEVCLLCMESIHSGEVIRLSCYDIFHWDCFNKWALDHPSSTPASKYLCPDCKSPVFPPKALVSPVADVIREKFASVAWGRRCLGLPLDPTPAQKPKTASEPVRSTTPIIESRPLAESTPKVEFKSPDVIPASKAPILPVSKPKKSPVQEVSSIQEVKSVQQVKPIEEAKVVQDVKPVQESKPHLTNVISKTEGKQQQPASWKPPQPATKQVPAPAPKQSPTTSTPNYLGSKFQGDKVATPHKVIDSRKYDDSKINVSFDSDENKYKRKGLTHWVGNLLSLNKDKKVKGKRDLTVTFKRVTVALIIFTLLFVTTLYLVSAYGRNFAASDPMLDPMKNPNIKVHDVLPVEKVAEVGGETV